MLCDYFNKHGKRIERIYIAMKEGPDAAQNLKDAFEFQNVERLLDAKKAEARISGTPTDLDDAALALNTLLHEVREQRLPISEAMQIVSIGIDFRKAVTIAEVLPSLEAGYGGYAVSWVRGIFRHLNLGPTHLH